MKVPFGTGHYKGRSTNINAQECVNFYPEVDEDSRHVVSLIGTPGMADLGTVAANVEIRGMHVFGSNLYVVAGDTLYEVDTDYVATSLGSLNTATGFCEMHDDGDYVVVCDGTDGYYYETSTSTFGEITDAAYPGGQSMTFQDGYHIAATPSNNTWYVSSLLDPTTWDALDYTTASGRSDNISRILSNRREVYVFKDKTTEIYYNTGATFPFERIPGAFIEYGIMARGAACLADNTIFWIDHDRRLRRAGGLQGERISTHPIEYQWSSYGTVSDCIMFSYVDEGHAHVIIQFPSEDVTWVYDASTNRFHRRQSYHTNGGLESRHRANAYAWFNNKHVIGDFEDGKIKEMSLNTYTDSGNTIRRQNVFPSISDKNGRRQLVYNSLEIEFEAGAGLTGDTQGDDPEAMLDWSEDGGHTWSNQLWRQTGALGNYQKRARWFRLGMSRERNFRLAVSDPIKWIVVAAYGEIMPGRS